MRRILVILVVMLFVAPVADASMLPLDRSVVTVVYQSYYGTGWWVDDTHIVTAAHVVGWESGVNVTLVKCGWSSDGRVIYVDAKRDVAVIESSEPRPSDSVVLPLSSHVSQLQTLYVAGYPAELLQLSGGDVSKMSCDPRIAKGFASWYNDKYSLIEFQAQVDAGNSGGPVTYSNGAVAGLVSFALSGKAGTLYFASDVEAIKDALREAGVHFVVIDPPEGESLSYELYGSGGSDNGLILVLSVFLVLVVIVAVLELVARNG